MEKHISILGNPKNEKIVFSKCKLYWFEKMFLNPTVQSVSYRERHIEVKVMIGNIENPRWIIESFTYNDFEN
ncbi:hypothetical protein [Bacillus sp. TL12]|uniref:hypothetical protein n=1 Tax=Bacillus sp. TL12 TaxID=2894756 RepID=UPI001F527BFD|nr:hypothetical protein [Bacillus sp. TL12]MCI0767445.1 hypothetical protein [Bacillus sp. TL12]